MNSAYEIKLSREAKRNWFRRGYCVEQKMEIFPGLAAEFSNDMLKLFLEELVIRLPAIPYFQQFPLTHSDQQLVDIRGRWLEANPIIPGKSELPEEELLYIDGAIVIPPEENELEEDDAQTIRGELEKTESVSFRYAVFSSFSEFLGSKHIKYNTRYDFKSPLAEEFHHPHALTFLKLDPINIRRARMGLEFFRSKYFGAWFGFTPDVSGYCYVEASPKGIIIQLSDDSVVSRLSPPLERFSLLESLNHALNVAELVSGTLRFPEK